MTKKRKTYQVPLLGGAIGDVLGYPIAFDSFARNKDSIWVYGTDTHYR